MLEKLGQNQLYAKFEKCEFWLEKIAFLGHVLIADGVAIDLAKIENEIKDIDKKNVSNSQNKENIEDQKCNKDDKKSIISNIIKKFYDSCNSHIIGKINSFYLNSDFPKKIDKTTMEEYNKLRELRDTIFSEDFFTISDLREKIAFYPGKYLNIHLREIMSLEPINNTSIQNFQIEYSNKFFQFAINNRIKALENQIEIAYDYTKGSGAETNFENKIIYLIPKSE